MTFSLKYWSIIGNYFSTLPRKKMYISVLSFNEGLLKSTSHFSARGMEDVVVEAVGSSQNFFT